MPDETSVRTASEETIFLEALALPAAERRAFVLRACGQSSAQMARVLALLDGYQTNSDFLDTPAAAAALRGTSASLPDLPREPGPGDRIGRYQLIERIGEGGFGVVFVAEQQEPVRRRVALKLIRLGMDTREFIARFNAERQALALMDHPNIARVFDAGATESGRPFLVMELVRGVPITRYCEANSLSIEARLKIFLGVCGAIQHAHQKGVIHRDLKPSNILVEARDGEPTPKVIDFGIAKATRDPLTDATLLTRFFALVGTPAYTSPEQLDMSGLDVDTRSDIYALGVLLYELLTGQQPFERAALEGSSLEEMRRIVREVDPPRPSVRVGALERDERARVAACRSLDVEKLPRLLRTELDWIVMRCLEKDRTRRYATANALARDVQRYLADEPVEARAPSSRYRLSKFVRRHRLGVAASAALLTVIVAGSLATTMLTLRALRAERLQNELREAAHRAEMTAAEASRLAEAQAQRLEKTRWARETALPEIARLVKKNDVAAAFALACQIEEFLPDDPVLMGLWPSISAAVSVETNPAGADIFIKRYDRPDAPWQPLGKSPLKDVRLPRIVHRWRIEKDGYTPVERADGWMWVQDGRSLACTLIESAATPAGMVRVQVRSNLPKWAMQDDFWIDKYEVTNRAFAEFVASGGYANEKFWKIPFVRDGETLTWSQAMALFHDRTGRPGPAEWVNGSYPEGQADHPVTGVSWFEAAAYAEFVGKRLPSVAHWRQAARGMEMEYLIPFGNFGSNGTAPVGAFRGVSTSGALDMAGNAREWCWNEAEGNRRFALGGGWGEPEYLYVNLDALPPFDRGGKSGFRCIKTDAGKAVAESFDAPVPPAEVRDYALESPVSDEQFAFIERSYAYDKSPLDARVEAVDEGNTRWRRERVSFNTAYNGERMEAVLFFPRAAQPPYQVVLHFPGLIARIQRSSETLGEMPVIEALLESHRVVVYPIYAGTYERQLPPNASAGEASGLEWVKHLVQDARRTIDYLETRPDLQADKLAFVGFSWGARMGPFISALESRIKVNVLMSGGLTGTKPRSEADMFTFVPRVTAPTLMINGRQDFLYLSETSQLPLFNALGTPAENKARLLVEGSHGFSVAQVSTTIREWLDRFLGPVDKTGSD